MARYKGTQASHLYEKSMPTLCTHLEHLFKFAGLGSEEASVEIGICPYKFAQMGGGRGSVLSIEGGYFFFEGLKGLVIPFAACFLFF